MKFEIPKDDYKRGLYLATIAVMFICLSVLALVFTPSYRSLEPLIFIFFALGNLFAFLVLSFLPSLFRQDSHKAIKLLIIFIFIGASVLLGDLAWLLLLSQKSTQSEPCTMPAGMLCTQDYLSSKTDKLNITILNGLQKTIIITNMSCTKDASQFEPIQETKMLLGQSASFVMRCNDEKGKALTFEQGDAFSGKINLEYYFENEGPGTKRKISGNIYVKAV